MFDSLSFRMATFGNFKIPGIPNYTSVTLTRILFGIVAEELCLRSLLGSRGKASHAAKQVTRQGNSRGRASHAASKSRGKQVTRHASHTAKDENILLNNHQQIIKIGTIRGLMARHGLIFGENDAHHFQEAF